MSEEKPDCCKLDELVNSGKKVCPECYRNEAKAELLACPFCGGQAAIAAFNQKIFIYCTMCEIRQREFFDPFDNKRQIQPAINRWNTRAGERRVLEGVLELGDQYLDEFQGESWETDYYQAGANNFWRGLKRIIEAKLKP